MPLHLLFPLLSSVLFVFGVLFAKRSITGGASPWTNTFLSNFWLAVCWGLAAVVQGTFLPVSLWWQAALVGLAFVLGQLLTYLAFQYGDVSVATPVFGVKIVMVAIALSLLAGEAVPGRVWLGAVLAAVGVAIVQSGPRPVGTAPRRAMRTIVLAMAASLSLTLFDIGLQTWGRQAGAGQFLPAMFLSVGLWSCGFLPWVDRPASLTQSGVLRPLVIGSILMTVQAMSMSYSLSRFGDAARINIVYALRGLWAVILSWVLASRFGGQEAKHSVNVMLLRCAGAVLLLTSVLIALQWL